MHIFCLSHCTVELKLRQSCIQTSFFNWFFHWSIKFCGIVCYFCCSLLLYNRAGTSRHPILPSYLYSKDSHHLLSDRCIPHSSTTPHSCISLFYPYYCTERIPVPEWRSLASSSSSYTSGVSNLLVTFYVFCYNGLEILKFSGFSGRLT